MNKEATIKAWLDDIRLSQEDAFEYDEMAILSAYKKNENNQSSIAIKVLSIFGGFLATIAFVGFFIIAGLYESESGMFILGSVFIVAAIFLNKISDKLIIDTFSISIYVIGFMLFAFGLVGMSIDENIVAILVIVIGSIALLVTQNYLLSFISILTISIGFLTLLFLNKMYDFTHLYIGVIALLMTYWFLNEAKIITYHHKLSRLYNPICIGLIISFLFGLMIIGTKNFIPIRPDFIWFSSIAIIPTSMYLITIITKINNIQLQKSKILIYALSLLIFSSTVLSPSISGAILILLLSFLVNYKTGLVIGIIALIYFIGQYYYDLSFTLLTKSIILFFSGVMFLVFYLFTNKKMISDEAI